MEGIVFFLGADAIFVEAQHHAVLLAAWLDAIHTTAIVHGRNRGVGLPAFALAARLKVFAIKFARGPSSIKWIAEGIAPHRANMDDWT